MKILDITRKIFLGIMVSGLFVGCTDLEVEMPNSILSLEEGADPTELLTGTYRNFTINYNNWAGAGPLQTMSSDVQITPIRTTGDWANNGRFTQVHTHTWNSNQEDLVSSFSRLNRNAFNASEVIFYGGSEQEQAEAKFIRAFAQWQIMDMWGVLPVRQVDESVQVNPTIYPRSEAIQFVIQDLNEAISVLPSMGPSNHDYATKEGAQALLARVYLNKAVYEASGPGSFSFSNTDMNEVISNVDAIISAGYTLDDDFYENYRGAGNENIFVSIRDMNQLWLPYLSSNQGGWNGFSITPELYDLYESGDDRLGTGPGTTGYVFDSGDFDASNDDTHIPQGILVGKQYKKDGTELSGIDYQKDAQLLGADPNEGYKLMRNSPDADTRFPILRLGDALLMKAEAILRGGSSSQTALEVINELRVKRNATPLTTVTLEDVLDERARETTWDGIRRTDQIRFGTFLSGTWTEKTTVTEDYKWVFPLPTIQVALNPNLEQNPGYPEE